ncbi:intraflagellar transport-associated protein [Pimephales promelas]|uniref:intraflagellar transport-associated protein n=1 Tax=Pimephales promelas TaxID=90988 RepID=UPI001955CDDE|nr:intraflagellar transport-associated protein [Pimephales promelas]XP_039512950.1 intraflagellar transport-associated protein [Pimephales promelas]XP_039512951.1 intraflagellar transport-associated protein [Pimephales promelas]XP_039512952.1 intraflagellar transport-associated protein [Pimephales promelas]KAG1933921.1 intraflagellar transport-associated protein isoform a [Pimephales promelas]
MPGLVNGSVVDNHDQAMTEALEQFCNSPEQTYEQFLSTFTHLTPENVRDTHLTAPRGHGDREMDNSRERQREDRVTEMEESVYRRMGQANRCSPTADQEEVLLDGGCVGGRLGGPSSSAPDRPVKFDNYLGDSEDEEQNFDATGTCALPGEIEEDLIAVSSSSLCHHTLLEISSTFTDQRTHAPSAAENQDESEEVVPFHLDEDFDYDNVVLSHKYVIQEQNG